MPQRPDEIDTEKYSDLKQTAFELLLNEYENQNTREFYQKRFRYWLAYCDERDDVDPYDVDRDDLKNYVRYLLDGSDRRIEHRIRAIRITYQILKEENIVESNPAKDFYSEDYLEKRPSNVRSVAENKEGPRANYDTINPDEFQKLLENVPAPRLRNQLIAKLLWQCMLRSEEIVNIRIKDIESGKNTIHIRDAKKNEKDEDLWYEVYYKDDVQYMLDRWINKERENLAPQISQESEYLLLTHQSPKMRPEHVSRIIKQSAKNAGIQEEMYTDGKGDKRWKVTAHALRRSSATYIANKTDYPIHFLADDLNHRSVDTTRNMYVREDKEERRNRKNQIEEL